MNCMEIFRNSVPKSQRFYSKAHTTTVPGPGSYDPRPKTSLPAASFAGKYMHHHSDTAPGPGQYNSDIYRRFGAFSYSIAGRPNNYSKPSSGYAAPGPGAYNLRGHKEKFGGKFAHAEREGKISEKSSFPGPGSYEGNSMKYKNGPMFS